MSSVTKDLSGSLWGHSTLPWKEIPVNKTDAFLLQLSPVLATCKQAGGTTDQRPWILTVPLKA